MTFVRSKARIKISLNTSVLLAVLAAFFFTPLPVFAEENPTSPSLPDFISFKQSVMDGQKDILRGVYVPETLAMPIVQQPTGNPGFVSTTDDQLTQFSMAAEVGNVGLLAHNYLAGKSFSNLSIGQEVSLIYGDGRVEYFVINRIVRYQTFSPYSPYSEFRDLETGLTITAEELFRQVYRGDRHVTFQTCIEAEGNSSWGRLFVIATPKETVEQDSFLHIRNLVR
ncbi:MAG: hypothetical protein HZB19_22730 [Chloroflexi bacterium]|nr:hypothetical protein [Chloroflexota bacterium]